MSVLNRKRPKKNQHKTVAALVDSPCRDKDDNIIIGTALSANAELIITGDEDLLVLKKYKGIDIVTPREFWSRLKG